MNVLIIPTFGAVVSLFQFSREGELINFGKNFMMNDLYGRRVFKSRIFVKDGTFLAFIRKNLILVYSSQLFFAFKIVRKYFFTVALIGIANLFFPHRSGCESIFTQKSSLAVIYWFQSNKRASLKKRLLFCNRIFYFTLRRVLKKVVKEKNIENVHFMSICPGARINRFYQQKKILIGELINWYFNTILPKVIYEKKIGNRIISKST